MDIIKQFFEDRTTGAEAEVTPQGILVNDTVVSGKENYKPINQAQNVSPQILSAIKKAYKAIPNKENVMEADTTVPDILIKANGEAEINPEKGQSFNIQLGESEIFDKILSRSDATSIRTTGKRSKMIGGNPRGETNLEDNYDLDPETGVWTSKEANKFGARTSFGESQNIVESFFGSNAPYDYEDMEHEVADRSDEDKPEEFDSDEIEVFNDIIESSTDDSENVDVDVDVDEDKEYIPF